MGLDLTALHDYIVSHCAYRQCRKPTTGVLYMGMHMVKHDWRKFPLQTLEKCKAYCHEHVKVPRRWKANSPHRSGLYSKTNTWTVKG